MFYRRAFWRSVYKSKIQHILNRSNYSVTHLHPKTPVRPSLNPFATGHPAISRKPMGFLGGGENKPIHYFHISVVFVVLLIASKDLCEKTLLALIFQDKPKILF